MRREEDALNEQEALISIHSLNEEWDARRIYAIKGASTHFNPLTQWRVRLAIDELAMPGNEISIHSLNEEWDENVSYAPRMVSEFQSTHSMKSETIMSRSLINDLGISIHSLNEEWDQQKLHRWLLVWQFQSTHSMKSETFFPVMETFPTEISIHSLNEEWDTNWLIF